MDLIGNEAPTHPERLGYKGSYLLDDYITKERPQIQTKYSSVEEDTYISQKDREILYNSKFSKVSILRRGNTEAPSVFDKNK
jgi:hypothetical protein